MHVGAPKSASTTIQAGLAQNRAMLMAQGIVIPPDIGAPVASSESHGRLAESLGGASTDPTRFDDHLMQFAEGAETIVLSAENFAEATKIAAMCRSRFLARSDVRVLFCVRPQAQWFEAAWWQWFHWERPALTVSEKLRDQLSCGAMDWASTAARLGEIPGVTSVAVVPVDLQDPQDFLMRKVLGISEYDAVPSARTRLPNVVVALYERFAELRPGPHDNAMDDAIRVMMGPALQGFAGTPAVMSRPDIEMLAETVYLDNIQLIRYLDNSIFDAFVHEVAWHTPIVRSLRPATARPEVRASIDEFTEFAAALLKAARHA